jgi:hypothetical protein
MVCGFTVVETLGRVVEDYNIKRKWSYEKRSSQ